MADEEKAVGGHPEAGQNTTKLIDERVVQNILRAGREALDLPPALPGSHIDLDFQLDALAFVCRAFDERSQTRETTQSVIVLALQAAFIIGTHAQAPDLARIFEKQRQSAGGRKGAASRRAQAEAGWKSRAKPLMAGLRDDNPGAANSWIVREVARQWDATWPRLPSDDWLKLYLAELEDEGALEKKKKTD